MSAIFQRPLCEMGAAYDFAFRPILGEGEPGMGGPCDDRPHRVELASSGSDPGSASSVSRSFSLCPEHETQLRQCDARLAALGHAPRFRPAEPTGRVRPPT